jgi:hypothetical protein
MHLVLFRIIPDWDMKVHWVFVDDSIKITYTGIMRKKQILGDFSRAPFRRVVN